MLSLIALLSIFAQPLQHAPVSLQVKLVVQCNSPMADQPVRGEGTIGTVCLHRFAFASDADVRAARLQKDLEGKPLIILALQDDAARRVRVVTGHNLFKRIGIVVNGSLLAAPMIAAPGTEIPIQGNLTQPRAERLVEDFNRMARRQ